MLSSFYTKFKYDINLTEFMAFYGYEFSPEEFDMPISIGGWQRTRSLRCSFDLKYLESNYTEKKSRIYQASKVNKTSIRKKKSANFCPPAASLFPSTIWDSVDSDIKDCFSFISNFQAKNRYTRLKKDPELRLRAWTDLYNERQKVFKKATVIPLDTVCSIELDSMKNVFPLDCHIDRWVDIKIINEPLRDPFNVPCPIFSALNKLGLTKDERYASCFWPLKAKTHDNILRAGARKDLARIINFVPPIYLWEEDTTVLPLNEKDFFDFMVSYPAPFLMGKVFEIYGKIPILKRKIDKDTWPFKLTEPMLYIYNKVKSEHFQTIIETMLRLNLEVDEVMGIYEFLVSSGKPSQGPPEDLEPDDLDDPEIQEYIESLRTQNRPKQLSWEDSWEAVSNCEKSITGFDSIYFSLDDTMKEIVDRAKKIYLQYEIDKFQLSADDMGQARELIIQFADEYPDFLELFGFEDPRAPVQTNLSSDDEGQFGDFNIDDFT